MARITRRAFLGGSVTSLLVGAGLYGYASTVEPTWLEVVRLDMPLRRLPEAFAGFTIAQISDLHFGPIVGPALIESAVQSLRSLNPDVIVITGDIVTRVSRGEPDMIVQTLSRLWAPHGIYAVMGNHDWAADAPLVTESLQQAGVTVLSNENLNLKRDGQSLYLAGIDDVVRGRNDFARAVAGIPADAAIVALVHEPDFADYVATDSRVLLQLSGHSHGGQVRLPFVGGLLFPPWGREYPMGLYNVQNMTLYTNRGIGMMAVPVRLGCRPEITLFTLKPA